MQQQSSKTKEINFASKADTFANKKKRVASVLLFQEGLDSDEAGESQLKTKGETKKLGPNPGG